MLAAMAAATTVEIFDRFMVVLLERTPPYRAATIVAIRCRSRVIAGDRCRADVTRSGSIAALS
jgi:hypothetical protein